MTRKKASLEGELSRVKSSHDNLLAKCKELQQSKDVIVTKLLATQQHQLASPSSTNTSMASTNSSMAMPSMPPIPKPRDPDSRKLRDDISHLQDEVARLRGELAQVQEERDKASREKTGVEIMFQESSRKSQHLTEEKIHLEDQITSLQSQVEEEKRRAQLLEEARGEELMEEGKWRVEYESLQDSLRALDKEKLALASENSKLARDLRVCREELDYVTKKREEFSEKHKQHKITMAELTEKMAAMETSASETAPKSYSGTTKLNNLTANLTARKLNDAMGQIKKLELVCTSSDRTTPSSLLPLSLQNITPLSSPSLYRTRKILKRS